MCLLAVSALGILYGCQGKNVPADNEMDIYGEQSLSQNSTPDILGEDMMSGSNIENAGQEEDRQDQEEKSERREYTEEDLEAAWNNRLGNYGVSLTALPNVEVYEEVYEIASREEEADHLLTIYGIRMEEPEYESINAGLAEMTEDERMYYETTGIESNTESNLYVSRLDGRVISVKNSNYLIFSNAATFDMTTGEKLSCTDIFADKDTAERLIGEDLAAQIENANWVSQFSSWEKEQAVSNAESFSLTNEEDYQWYLDGESIVIAATVANHRCIVVLPYREYAYLFWPQYLPGEGIAYYRSNNTGIGQIEFNGVVAKDVDLLKSDSSVDYSDVYPDVVGYYLNDGMEEYICISAGGIYDHEHRSYLCRFTENGIEPLTELEGKKEFSTPWELQEWID